MNKIWLIIEREYLSRVKKKSFILMTLLGPILLGLVITSAVWLTLEQEDQQIILVYDEAGIITANKPLSNGEKVFFINNQFENIDAALNTFKNSGYTSLLYIPQNIATSNMCILHYNQLPSLSTQKQITYEIESQLDDYKLKLFDIDASTFKKIKSKVSLSTVDFKQNSTEAYEIELTVIGFFFAVMIYMFIFMYGVQVMRGVIEEKTNRIVEVIVSSVKPFQLMMGKIIGIAMVGLTQFTLWVILSTVAIQTGQYLVLQENYGASKISAMQMTQEMQDEAMKSDVQASMVIELLDRINFPLMISTFLFYFIGGFLLYASLFAAIGSAVDSESDTQQFMMPVTLPLIFGFIVAEMALQNPEGSAVFWFSLFPLTSPIVMMVRVAGGVETWQLLLSIAMLIATFIVTTFIAAKVYRIGILMYGKKPSYKEIWKWLKY